MSNTLLPSYDDDPNDELNDDITTVESTMENTTIGTVEITSLKIYNLISSTDNNTTTTTTTSYKNTTTNNIGIGDIGGLVDEKNNLYSFSEFNNKTRIINPNPNPYRGDWGKEEEANAVSREFQASDDASNSDSPENEVDYNDNNNNIEDDNISDEDHEINNSNNVFMNFHRENSAALIQNKSRKSQRKSAIEISSKPGSTDSSPNDNNNNNDRNGNSKNRTPPSAENSPPPNKIAKVDLRKITSMRLVSYGPDDEEDEDNLDCSSLEARHSLEDVQNRLSDSEGIDRGSRIDENVRSSNQTAATRPFLVMGERGELGRATTTNENETGKGLGEVLYGSVSGILSRSSTLNDFIGTVGSSSGGSPYLISKEEMEEKIEQQNSLIPPDPTGSCSRRLQDKVSEMYARMLNGRYNPNSSIQRTKNFRNPSIYEKLVNFCQIDEKGTNYPSQLFDPNMWGPESRYENLAKLQKLDMERRERERKEKKNDPVNKSSAVNLANLDTSNNNNTNKEKDSSSKNSSDTIKYDSSKLVDQVKESKLFDSSKNDPIKDLNFDSNNKIPILSGFVGLGKSNSDNNLLNSNNNNNVNTIAI